MRQLFILFLSSIFLTFCTSAPKNQWQDMIKKNSLESWKVVENEQAFQVSNNVLTCRGAEAMVIYDGENYSNFELQAEIMTQPGANTDILFHTGAGNENTESKGYAVKLNNTYKGMKAFPDIQMTGSLNRIRNIYFPLVKDNNWFDLRLKVQENQIAVFVDGEQTVDYVEPKNAWRPEDLSNRILGEGTFAIRCNKGNEMLKIRSMKVKALPDTSEASLPVDKNWNRKVTKLHVQNFPLIDFHIHLKGDLTLPQALEMSRHFGVNYGIAANCGLKFPITNDEQLLEYINSQEGKPVFTAMQAEGREWVDLFSPEAVAKADYVFTDAMTWTNNQGQRMRLWIPEETHVGDPQSFMEQLVSEIQGITREPIDIYVNPTYLPAKIEDSYDELWTEDRIDRVVAALKKNDIALEINDRLELPGKRILQKAKEAGVKFTLGTNNTDENIGKLDYSLRMIEELNIQPEDMWLPPVNE